MTADHPHPFCRRQSSISAFLEQFRRRPSRRLARKRVDSSVKLKGDVDCFSLALEHKSRRWKRSTNLKIEEEKITNDTKHDLDHEGCRRPMNVRAMLTAARRF